VARGFSATAAGALAALSAALLVLCFPPFAGGAVIGSFALVPLLFALRGAGIWRAAMLGVLFGALSNLGIFSWLLAVPGIHVYQFAVLDAVFCLYPALWCVLVSRLDPSKPVYELAVATLWVSVEYVRAHSGFLALPWATLAQTQVSDTWLLQSAALFGEPVVSFLVALGNVVIYRVLGHHLMRERGMRLALLAWTLPIVAAFGFGAWVVRTNDAPAGDRAGPDRRQLEVAALQTQYAAYGPRRVSSERRMTELLAFMRRDWPSTARLAVLPESSFSNLDRHPDETRALVALSRLRGSAVIAGVAQAAKFEQAPEAPVAKSGAAPPMRLGDAGHPGVPDRRAINAAWIFTPDGAPPLRYRKVRRLPFAEYQPLAEGLRWPRWLVGRPIEVVPGHGPRAFALGADRSVGVLICWESLFAAHSRALAQQGAAVLVLLTNEAWFEQSAASAQHDLAARMRAVETGRSVVVASNAGRSLIIDRFGRITAARAAAESPRWITGTVRTVTELAPYVLYGDAFAFACLALSFVLLALPLLFARRSRRTSAATRTIHSLSTGGER
jgi:apolipoprotein N-acyltransferase